METKVAGILGALSQLEQDLDSLESSVSDMKKSITTKTNSEIESVSIKVRQSASAKAEQIVAAAKAKAEQESDEISKNGQIKLEEIRARISDRF